jgi:hypothetical protein
MDCVARVKASGKSESEAWAICIKSTGLKPHKKKSELINHLITLANSLDEKGESKMASAVDDVLKQQVKMAAWEEEEDPTGADDEWKFKRPENYDSYNIPDMGKAIIRALELVKSGVPSYRAHTQAFKEFGQRPFSRMFAPTTSEASGVVRNIIKKHPEARNLLISVGLQDLLSPKTKKSEPEKIEPQKEPKTPHERISEPMPGEVPSAEELEKWLKSSKLHSHLIALANKLDELNLPEEASLLDTTLEKEAQWQWMKEKGQQMKDWYQGEKQPDIDVRTKLTKLRQNHWDLVKKLNTAYQLLTKSHKNIGKPEYLRDITSMINYILKDIQRASASVQTILTQQPQQPQVPQAPTAPATSQPPAAPIPGVPPATPGAAIAPGASLVERLTKLADKLEAKGEKEAAKVVRAQWQTATEMGQKGMDWMLGRGESPRAQSDKQWSNFHWRVANIFKNAYDKLSAVRQYLNDADVYPERFQAVANEIQTDLNTLLGEIQQAGQPTAAPVEETPLPEEEAASAETQNITQESNLLQALQGLSQAEMSQVVDFINQLRQPRATS